MVEDSVQALVKELRSHGDSAQAEIVRGYMKTSSLDFYGIKLPVIRKIAKQYSKSVNPEGLTPFLEKLWAFQVFDVRRAAAEVMLQFLKRGRPEQEVMQLVDAWIDDIDTWALTDPLGWCVGQLLIKNPSLRMILKEWGKSGNKWRRRMAIVPYVELSLRDQYRPEYGSWILEAVTPHIGDSEFFVGKAVAWALRQMSYHAPELVRQFIEEHKTQMTQLVIREGSRKL